MTKKCFNSLVYLSLLIVTVIANGEEISLHDKQKYDVTDEDAAGDDEWWNNAVIYQIYPKSFFDSNGDGVGDLKGITKKLEHLKDAGITGTWLSPIFPSGGADQGYDISDYRSIDPAYGTMDDFKALLAEAKRLGIRIILDFVPNHTSDEHLWFKWSEENHTEYMDYYIWKDEPNNWISSFRGSSWTYSHKREQYYYHAFHKKQPDLNYRCNGVVTDMKNILSFWMDLGIDGFRMDAVPFLVEDDGWEDEPLARGRTYDMDDDSSLNHIYTQNQEGTYDMIYQWREHLDNYAKKKKSDKKLMMTEVYASIEETMLYFGDGTRLGSNFPFNFNFIKQVDTNFTVDDIVYAIHSWLDNIPSYGTNNWVLGNHDNHRVGSRLGEKNMDAFNMVTAFLPGVMITYYGEEIGMLDGQVTCEQGHDSQAQANNCSKFDETSRDFERTPFQWDNTTNAGFSTSKNSLYLPVADNYLDVNLKNQVDASGSHYNLYKDVIKFRQRFQNKSKDDSVVAAKASENVLEIVRHRDEGEYLLFFNIGDKEEQFKFLRTMQKYEVVITTPNQGNLKKGSLVSDTIQLQPHQSVILVQSEAKSGATKSLYSIVIVFICVVFNIYF